MVLLNALLGLSFILPASAADGGAPAYTILYNSEAGGGVPAGLPAIMRLIRSKEKELGVSTSSSSRLELGDGAAAFTTAVEAAEDAGGGAVEDPGAPPHQLRPGPPREGGLAVRTLFDLNSDTVKKRSQVKGGGDNNTMVMTLDNKGRPYSRLALSSPEGDLQVYHRDTDYIIYTQAADGRGGISLKEWLYALKPGPGGRTAYSWSFESGSKNQAIELRREPAGGIGVYSRLVAVGIDAADRKRQASVMETVRKAFRSEVKIGDERLLARLQPVVYWTVAGERKTADFNVTGAGKLDLSLAEPPESYPLIIDPTLNWGQWLGANEAGEAHIKALAVDTATGEIYIGGHIGAPGIVSESITWQGTHSGLNEGFVVEIQDGATPVINWGQWLGGVQDDYVYALAVNGDEIYAGGHSIASSSGWETITWQGAFSGSNEGFVVEIQDGATPVINWGQWLGGTGNDAVRALAVNGDEIYVGGDSWSATSWEAITWQGTHSGGNEGFVVEIQDGATPTINWGQWLGGTGNDTVYALAVNVDEIYAGGNSYDATSWETITWQGAHSGNSEGFVVEIQDGATPVINWGQWLGGTGIDYVYALAVNGDEIYAGGYSGAATSWETITWQGAYSGSYESFVVEIQDGAAPAINWGQWLGGTGAEYLTALAVNGDEIYASGYTYVTTGWETITWQGAHSGSSEGFVVEIQDGATPTINWGQWLGGTGEDCVYALAVNGDQIYAPGETNLSDSWESITWQGAYNGGYEGFVVEIQDGATPAINWGQWLGGGIASAEIKALAVNGDEIYAGGYSGSSVAFESITWQGAHSGSSEGFVVEIQDGVTPVISWGQWLGGTGNDYVRALAVNGDEIYAGGDSQGATGWETITWQGAHSGDYEGFVVEIQDGVTPAINWGQWLGGTSTDRVYALAVNGDEIYAGGSSYSATGWETVTWQGAHSGNYEGFVVEIQDGVTPAINWGQWLGGTSSNGVYALAVNGDEIYAGGFSGGTTSWEAVTWQGAHSGGNEGFVVEIQDGAAPVINWGQWLGGAGYDYVQALAVNGDEIYAAGYSPDATSWETIAWQGGEPNGNPDGFVVEIQDGATPVINWGQWLGGTGVDFVYALAVNGDKIYAGGHSGDATSWEAITWQGTHSGGNEGFVVEIQDGASPVINWGQWLGGTGHEYFYALAVNGDEIYAGGYSPNSSGWENITWQGTHNGIYEAFIVKILPPADPTFPSHW